jgi:hypothetical protein
MSAVEGLTPNERLLVEAIADRVAELLHPPPTHGPLVDAKTLADTLGVSRDYIYAHAEELGGKRIGTGLRGRLRFDVGSALAAWTACCHSKESQPQEQPTPTERMGSRPGQRMGSSASLLPINGSRASAVARQERP